MIKELYSDNSGICRFHRGWVEKIIEKLINDLFDEKIDYFSHHKKLVQKINAGNQPIFWESEKVIDIIKIYLEKVLTGEPDNKDLQDLVDEFNKDKFVAAKKYWQIVLDGQNEALR